MELIYESPRVLAYNEVAQDQHRHDDVVLLEENRLRAAARAALYQQARCFEEGNLVLRRV